jgi:hypothetical protein
VVDPVDLRLAERLGDAPVQRPGRGQIAAERLLDDDAAAASRPLARFLASQAGLGETLHDDRIGRRGRGQVVEVAAAGGTFAIQLGQSRGQAGIARRVLKIERVVVEPLGEAVPLGRLGGAGAAVAGHALAHLAAELVVARRSPRYPEHGEGHGQSVLELKRVERGNELAPGQVAGGAEDDDQTRVGALPFPRWGARRPRLGVHQDSRTGASGACSTAAVSRARPAATSPVT